MTLLEKQRVQEVEEHRPGFQMWMIVALISVTLLAVGIVVWQSGDSGTAEPAAGSAAVVEPAAQSIFTNEELIMMELANQGYIPSQAVDWDTIELKKLVSQGLVSEQALQAYRAPAEPLFTQEELATIDLAEKGLIPWQTVDWEAVELKRLANKGLIPRQAAP